MKRKKTYLILASLVFFSLLYLPSCEKAELVEVVGFIQGYVYYANDNTHLDGVTIKWSRTDGSQDSVIATAADGFLIENLRSGKYILECSKEGFSGSTIAVEIPKQDHSASVKGGGGLEYIATASPVLYSLATSVKGRVYKYDDRLVSGVYTPAVGEVVKLLYPFGNLEPNVYESVTDNEGYYTFENVPAAQGTIMIANYKNGNFNFYPFSSHHDFIGRAGSTSSIEPVYLYPYEVGSAYSGIDPLILVDCNVQIAPRVGTNNFSVSDNIELEFNRELNEEITNGRYSKWGDPAWFYDQFGNDVSYTVTFNGNRLIIDPDTDLAPDTYYQLGVLVCGESMSDLYYTGWYTPSYISFKTAP